MASKPTPKKGAAKKAAELKKSAPAKAASKGGTAPKKTFKPAPKTAKPAPRPPAKPVTKQAKPPAPKPAAKAVPAAASVVVKPAPVAAPPPAPAPVPASVSPKPTVKAPAPSGALTLSVQSSQGLAANGNTHPANLLVIVTCAGVPVVELSKDHFTLMEHFEVPGQTAPFSNNITSFRNAGTGAYLLQTKPITGAPWRSGHHLGQLLISDDDERQGQAAFKLIIR